MGRLLLVEDEEAIARMYALRLRQDGWEVKVATSGEDAIATALKAPPDVVLLDMMLPGIDGIGVLQRLRENGPTATVPVLVLSNSPGAGGKLDEAMRLGVVAWRTKATTTPGEVSRQVRRYLRAKK